MGNFNTPLTPMDKLCSQKINKETQALNGITNQSDLTDTYRTLYPKVAKHTFFPSAYRTHSRRNHIFIHKSSLAKFKKTEIISSISSNQNAEIRNQL